MAIFKKTSSVNFPKTNIEAFLHHAPCHAQSPVALFAAGSKEAITSARNCASQLLNKGGRRSKHSSSLTVLAGKRNEEVFQLPTAFWTQMLWWSFGLLFFWCWFIGWRPRHQHQVGCFAWLRSWLSPLSPFWSFSSSPAQSRSRVASSCEPDDEATTQEWHGMTFKKTAMVIAMQNIQLCIVEGKNKLLVWGNVILKSNIGREASNVPISPYARTHSVVSRGGSALRSCKGPVWIRAWEVAVTLWGAPSRKCKTSKC